MRPTGSSKIWLADTTPESAYLHGECFYEGKRITRDTERRIRETIDYIADAEGFAYDHGTAR